MVKLYLTDRGIVTLLPRALVRSTCERTLVQDPLTQLPGENPTGSHHLAGTLRWGICGNPWLARSVGLYGDRPELPQRKSTGLGGGRIPVTEGRRHRAHHPRKRLAPCARHSRSQMWIRACLMCSSDIVSTVPRG